jgi:hypothetical protein
LKFRALVIPSGNAMGVEVPREVVQALGPKARPPVKITIQGHSWRSAIAAMRGMRLIGISAANRTAAGVVEGEIVEIDIELDTASREVVAPPDLAHALDQDPGASAAFYRLPFGLKQKYLRIITEAKTAETRQRRVSKFVASLKSGD